jgi:hypothetical protein
VKLADISGTKGSKYLKAECVEFETKNKIKISENSIGVSVTKKGYHPRTNIVKDKKGDWVTDCHSILARWINHFSQLLSVHGVMMLGRQKYIQQNH